MKKRRLKALAVALALTVTLSPMTPAKGVSGGSAITTTVEAATKKLSLKVGNKKAYVGKTTKISAKATNGVKLSYKTSNKKIATVNSKGVITGKKAGTVKITITAKKSKYKTIKKTITVKVYRQNQSISVSNVKLTIGQKKNLGAKARTRLAYKSSNQKVVTVDKKGNLTAKKTGTAKITVTAPANNTYNKASRTITVTVVKKSIPKQTESVKPTQSPKQTEAAKPTATPIPTATPVPTTMPEPTKAPQPTATPEPTKAPAPTETPKPTSVPEPTKAPEPTETPAPDISYVTDLNIEKTSDDTLYVGSPKECNVKWKSTGNTTRKDFIYVSSDTSIATIDENGTITPLKAGKVTITVASKTPFAESAGADCLSVSKRYTVKVQYNDAYIGVGFPNPENVAETGRNVDIGATINPMKEDTGDYSVENMEKYLEFSSSNPSVATIDAQGNITGVSKGYVTLTVKTKLPVDPNGQNYKENSVTYHVGDYTYEEILNGLTVDMEASRTAHNILNDMREHKSSRPAISQDFPEVSARTWDNSAFQNAAVRGSRNIICEILGGWTTEEKSTVNALASHGYSQNGYGGSGWESTGESLGQAASEFFQDRPHAQNQTRADEVYGAVAVVQYKNAAGINLTSMIVEMVPYSYEEQKANNTTGSWINTAIKATIVPADQYYDICNHFGLTCGMETINAVSETSLTDGEEVFTDGSDIQKNDPVLTDPAPAVAESEKAGFENEEQDSEEIDIEDSDSVEEEINITEENEE